MKTHLSLLSLPLFLLLSLTPSSSEHCHAADRSSTLVVFHSHGPCSPLRPPTLLSWRKRVLQMQATDEQRMEYLSSGAVAKKSVVPIASGRQIINSPTYVVRAKIGTPAQTLLLAMDTGSDVAWIPCSGCVGCSASSPFAPTSSSSFSPLSCRASQCKQVPNPICGGAACGFNLTYGGSAVSADLVQDTITLATDPVSAYTFGCIRRISGGSGSSTPPQGLLGLGRGPLSLLSQAQSLYQSTFSYCLPSFKSMNFTGSLRLGPAGQPKRIKFTPLLKNPRRSSLYYVNLIGIRVGRKIVDIPPSALAFNPVTGAGTIIDSGTVFTRLVAAAYTAVRDQFRLRVGKNQTVSSLGGFDTCYTGPINAPTITFMFSGMNVTLPTENILIHSSSGSTTCLAMAAAPDNVNSVLNVLANMQQQNHRILIDVPNSRVGVARELCT